LPYHAGVTRLQAAPRPLRSRDPRLGPWRAFLAAHARVWRRLDEDLRAEHRLSLPEYEALLLLAQAGDRRLRMRALAEALQLSKSGVTRLVDRLVEDGLAERRQ
jgi:DNA-binding MarR family transcriptional regulator